MKPDRIRAIMREHNLTCKMLADLCGVNWRTMESYIQGRRGIPEYVAISILHVEETR